MHSRWAGGCGEWYRCSKVVLGQYLQHHCRGFALVRATSLVRDFAYDLSLAFR